MVSFNQYSDEFHALRDAAHKRPVTACGPLSLIRFRAWWPEYSSEPPQSAPDAPLKELFQNSIDDIVDSRRKLISAGNILFRHFTQLYSTPQLLSEFNEGNKPIFNGQYKVPYVSNDALQLSGYIGGVLLKINITFHSDYLSLTQILDFSKINSNKSHLDPDAKTPSFHIEGSSKVLEDRLSSNFDQLRTALLTLYSKQKLDEPDIGFRTDEYKNAETQSHLPAVADDLYDKVWNDIDDWFGFRMPGPKGVHDQDKDDTSSSDKTLYLALFADFRGLVVPSQIEQLNSPEKRLHPLSPDYQGKDDKVEMPSHKCPREWLRRYWPLAKATDKDFAQSDFVACSAIRRKAVYVSALGYTTSYRQAHTQPVKYLVIADAQGRWQIGRLVNRINRMGCYRLMALRNLELIHRTSVELRVMGQLLDKIDLDISARNRETLEGALKQLQMIGRGMNGGLAYRVYRSRYYVHSLYKMLEDFDARRIEGFQPYDAFVRRRLSETYEVIDRTGTRLRRLRERFTEMLSIVQSLLSLKTQEDTAQQTRDIAEQTRAVKYQTEQSISQTKSIHLSQKKIESLLLVGEAVGTVAATYYLGNILYEALKILPNVLPSWMFSLIYELPKFLSFLIAFIIWWPTQRWIVHGKLLGRLRSQREDARATPAQTETAQEELL